MENNSIIPYKGYVSSIYEPPDTLLNVGSFVDSITGGKKDTLPDLLRAPVNFGIFLLCTILVWFIILLVLKYYGRNRFGCAAGFAFDLKSDWDDTGPHLIDSRLSAREEGLDIADVSQESCMVADDNSTSVPSLGGEGRCYKNTELKGDETSDKILKANEMRSDQSQSEQTSALVPLKEEKSRVSDEKDRISKSFEDEPQHVTSGTEDATSEEIYSNNAISKHETNEEDPSELESKTKNNDFYAESIDDTEDTSAKVSFVDKVFIFRKGPQSLCCSTERKDVERRIFLTRIVFCSFANVCLICSTLLISQMLVPLENSTAGSALEESTRIAQDISGVLKKVDETRSIEASLSKATSVSYEDICPGLPMKIFVSTFDLDPAQIVKTFSDDLNDYIPLLSSLVDSLQDAGSSLVEGLEAFIYTITVVNKNLWPIKLIISITILIVITQLAMVAVAVYIEEESKVTKKPIDKRLETGLTWIVLPIQVIVVFSSCLLIVAFCFGVIGTYEVCTPAIINTDGITRGTPDDFLIELFNLEETDTTSSVIDERLLNYLTGCQEDPLQDFVEVQKTLKVSLNYINRQLEAFEVNRPEVISRQCGQGNQVEALFDDLGQLNQELSEITQLMKEVYDIFACPRINSIYKNVVHEALCTDFAIANTNGFVLMIVVTISSLILVTLRASWKIAV